MPKFVLKDGQLSQYSLICGDVQRASDTGDKNYSQRIDLYKEGCYYVKGFDFAKQTRICLECFDSITDARKFWELMVRKHSLILHKNRG